MSAGPPNLGLAYRLSVRKWGVGLKLLTSQFGASEAAKTATLNFDPQPDQVFWLIMNRSPYSMEINWVGAWTFGTGLFLAPNGGWASMDADEDGEAVTYPVWRQFATTPANLFYIVIRRA